MTPTSHSLLHRITHGITHRVSRRSWRIASVATAVVLSLVVSTVQPATAGLPAEVPVDQAMSTLTRMATPPDVDKEELEKAYKDASSLLKRVSDDGNSIEMARGRFDREDDELIVRDEDGKELIRLPLVAVYGQKMADLEARISADKRTVTFSTIPGSIRDLSPEIQEVRDKGNGGYIGRDTRLRAFYNTWGKYLNRMEVENFPLVVAGGAMGAAAGFAGGLALGFLAAGIIIVGAGVLNVFLPIPATAVVIGLTVGIIAALMGASAGAILGTMVVGLTSENEATRTAAGEAIKAFFSLVYFWWLPPSKGDPFGSGVGSTGPKNPPKN